MVIDFFFRLITLFRAVTPHLLIAVFLYFPKPDPLTPERLTWLHTNAFHIHLPADVPFLSSTPSSYSGGIMQRLMRAFEVLDCPLGCEVPLKLPPVRAIYRGRTLCS